MAYPAVGSEDSGRERSFHRAHPIRNRRRTLKGLRIGLALIIVPSLALGAVQFYQVASIVPDLRRSQELVAHTFAVISTARAIDHGIQDAERGQRGYLITGDDVYLEPYRFGVKEAPARLEELRRLTLDDPEQQNRVGDLQTQINRKLEEMRRTVDVRQKQGFEAARQLVQTDVGLDAMRTITSQIEAIIESESNLLKQQQQRLIDIDRSGTISSLLAAALALAVMVVGGTLLTMAFLRILRSQESLERSEERFRLLVSGVKDYAIFMLDPGGCIVSWNEGAERIKGYGAKEILGSHVSRLYTPEEVSAGLPEQLLETAAADGRAEVEGWRVRKDGSRIWANVVVTALRDLSGNLRGFAKVTRDITERHQHELALEQSRAMLAQLQKIEALGQLTGGVAHDFNNILTTIMGSVELLQRRAASADSERTARLLAAVQRAAEQGAALTQRLLAFSRQQALAPNIVDVNKLVGAMSALLHRTLGENIAIETVLGAGLWRTYVDPNQLESAIINLAVNARDAMPNGGKLTIETGNTHLDDRYAATHSEVKSGQYVMVAVSDTGEGMTSETIMHAFEPFFTTKPEGKGTGLGLSQVHGFVKQSGGHIELYSELGHGTTIKIYLPRSAAMSDPEPEVEQPQVASTVEGEAVLVVEDNADVRQYSADALASLGYRVLQAPDANTALRVLDEHPEVALMFTDVGLPGLNGRRLAEEAKSRMPHLKILFTTGYARNAIVHNGILDVGVDLLAKPFTVEGLGRKLRQMLRGA
jgi:PAS domain S-box-containing protein